MTAQPVVSPARASPSPPLPGRLFSLGENMIEILVEGAGEVPESLFGRYLARTDDRSGPKSAWQSGTLSADVSAWLRGHAAEQSVQRGAEVSFSEAGFTVFFRVAGDAYDVTAAAAALGTPAYLLSATGDCAASAFMRRWMLREGVHLDYCPHLPGKQVAAHFLVRGRKRYSRWGSASSTLSPGQLELDYGLADFFHTFGGTTQMLSPSMRATVREHAARAREGGATVSYNLNDRPDLRESTNELLGAFDEVAPFLDLLFVGAEETVTVFGLDRSPSDSADTSADTARIIARTLLPRCPLLQCLFVTDGKHGVHLFQQGQRPRHLSATLVSQAEIVEPIGAGDAFVGGTLHGLLHGFPPHRAAEIGMVTAQLNTLGHGAVVLPDRSTVLQHLAGHFAWPPQMLRRV